MRCTLTIQCNVLYFSLFTALHASPVHWQSLHWHFYLRQDMQRCSCVTSSRPPDACKVFMPSINQHPPPSAPGTYCQKVNIASLHMDQFQSRRHGRHGHRRLSDIHFCTAAALADRTAFHNIPDKVKASHKSTFSTSLQSAALSNAEWRHLREWKCDQEPGQGRIWETHWNFSEYGSIGVGVYNSTGELVSDNRHLASAYFKDLTIYESILGLELLWPW